ncbi:MAG: hypothetical protein K9N10_03480 [Deltaproteobacteria bacterium]|nr:hypothetical protein [Deltaproteobacteria bacterium]
MNYVCIHWKSYKNLCFDGREKVREELRRQLEDQGIRFQEYCWVWDENDQCVLVTGAYERLRDAEQWITTLESLGFEIEIRTGLPGENPKALGIRRGWDSGRKGIGKND